MSTVPRHRKHGLAFKLALLVLTGTALVFAAAFSYNYWYARKLILSGAEKYAAAQTAATVNRIETVLNGVEKVPAYLARTLETRRIDREALERDMRDLLATHPEIFGTAIAFEPYAFDRRIRLFAPYCVRNGKDLRTTLLGSETYNYLILDWYQIPRELERPVWSEPYFDEDGGNATMATFSRPFYRGGGTSRELAGIVTADVSLDWLLNIVSSALPAGTGYAYLVSANGVFVSHPDKQFVMRESIFSLAEANADDDLRRIGRDMIRGKSGFTPVKSHLTGGQAWIHYAPLPSLGWSLAIVLPEARLFAGIASLNQRVLAIGFAGLAALALVVVLISRTVTRPLRALAGKAGEIAQGNLDADVPILTVQDEVGDLSRSFDHMKSALKEYIVNLAETTAAKERIESELKIARTIQMNFLPKHFPPFPEHEEFDIFAALEPAREVGGDLYDFYLLSEDKLLFAVGDVSGKGVPAALFMAVTKSLMKGVSNQDTAAATILADVNAELCRENDATMFVSLFCGILDIRTGDIEFANGGHNPPVLMPASGEPRYLQTHPGLVLGVMEEAVYVSERIRLAPGDTLLLYTDGVTEAMNDAKAFFGEPALLELAARNAGVAPTAIIPEVLDVLRDFAGTEPQWDDITLLALRYRGRSS